MSSRMISSCFRKEMTLHTPAAGGVAEVSSDVHRSNYQFFRNGGNTIGAVLSYSIQYVLVFCILYSVFNNGTEVGEDFADDFSFFIFWDTVFLILVRFDRQDFFFTAFSHEDRELYCLFSFYSVCYIFKIVFFIGPYWSCG